MKRRVVRLLEDEESKHSPEEFKVATRPRCSSPNSTDNETEDHKDKGSNKPLSFLSRERRSTGCSSSMEK